MKFRTTRPPSSVTKTAADRFSRMAATSPAASRTPGLSSAAAAHARKRCCSIVPSVATPMRTKHRLLTMICPLPSSRLPQWWCPPRLVPFMPSASAIGCGNTP